MHLKSITLKGFKSFPDRTRLDFAPGVSVIVGPNGSGKSNITDAVLWALGEQSPTAVRGQSMQDVIFAGGHGTAARQAAEVEVVIDNADGQLAVDFAELSILRRLDRAGEGEYRLNGARCRLVDVIEALSDTGLGKEMHSVVSQGRVEAIVTSKPRDRRLLIEEAAGLGKHRKRRRRAQLKLARTQDNLDRALDVEREARGRLRPLKRQAEAADLHRRLERQSTEARWELTRETARGVRAALAEAQAAATAARERRARAEALLAEVAARREGAEEALARGSREREARSEAVFAARSAAERIGLRLEAVRAGEGALAEGVTRRAAELEALEAQARADAPDDAGTSRIAALRAALAEAEDQARAALELELVDLERERTEADAELARRAADVEDRRAELAAADARAEAALAARRDAERAVTTSRAAAASAGAELAAVNQFLRSHAGAPSGTRTLADELRVAPGYELALAAALGRRLRAAMAPSIAAGGALLDAAGPDGGSALVPHPGGAAPAPAAAPPVPGAERLLDRIEATGGAAVLAATLLADAWVVDALEPVPAEFRGIAVTKAGRVWFGASRELRQAAEGGTDRVLTERNRRTELIAASERAAQAEQAAATALDAAAGDQRAADGARETAFTAVRVADRAHDEAAERARRAAWVIEQRREAPAEGPAGARRAQLAAELAAEERVAERAERARTERARRIEQLRARVARDRGLIPVAQRLGAALESLTVAVGERVVALEAELEADRAAGDELAAQLRACAQEEAAIQAALREAGEAVTGAEVSAQRARDQAAEVDAELEGLATALGLEAEPAPEPLADAERLALEQRIERLARRREQLGPVNPLAQQEYDEALEHVEELERQRTDLETALRELQKLIRDCDRMIREAFETTFAAAARNFEEVAEHLFPGGSGRLRLVKDDPGPRSVLGGQALPADADAAEAHAEAEEAAIEAAAEAEEADPEELLGVEIEITPAGKSKKRLSLLSGGEKSLTALAFLFAVFLAKPCPFYILDEVEAALDDLNIDRFLQLLTRFSDRAQFIVVTHQKRTMEAADVLYGVSMGGDGISKVISRRLPREQAA